MSKGIVYFDLETQLTANDVGGWNRKHEMKMSIGVTYNAAEKIYRIYPESRVEELIDELLHAELVVGYNTIHFDYEVLMGYTILDLPGTLRSLDLMADVEKILGHRLKLDALAHGTFGYGKTADGLDAIKWWREGKILQIAEYCCFDVKVTRMVHEYGARNKELFFTDRFSRRQKMNVAWSLA